MVVEKSLALEINHSHTTEEDVVDFLKRAREIFIDRGGARGVLLDNNGRVCAIGALEQILAASLLNTRSPIPSLVPKTNEMSSYSLAQKYLDQSACALYTRDNLNNWILPPVTIASVNDFLGKDAALAVYDHAIKTLEGE